jgi:hypothetical protein
VDDYPGIFEMDLSKLNPDNSHVNSTIANQFFICNDVQPLQMAADLPKLQPLLDAFQFIKDVAI